MKSKPYKVHPERYSAYHKVVHVTYDMRIGGTESVIKNLIETTSGSSCHHQVICLQPRLGPFGEELKKKGIEIHSLNWSNGFDVSVIKALRRFIDINSIDCLHCHQYTPWVYGTLAAAGTRTRVIFTEHGRFYPDSSNWKRKFINPLLVLLTDKITAISKATKAALSKYEFIPGNKIDVIYNGLTELEVSEKETTAIRESLEIPDDAFILGTIARFDPIKNHSMMLEAFSLALQNNPKLTLIMVGDGEERKNIESKIDSLDIRDKVRLTGYQSDPSAYLSLFDIFLLSSLSEGTSMTLLESLSLGIPCIVTDAGGNPEIIQHGVCGLVTPNDDALSFSKAIEKLSSSDLSVMRKKRGNNLRSASQTL